MQFLHGTFDMTAHAHIILYCDSQNFYFGDPFYLRKLFWKITCSWAPENYFFTFPNVQRQVIIRSPKFDVLNFGHSHIYPFLGDKKIDIVGVFDYCGVGTTGRQVAGYYTEGKGTERRTLDYSAVD